MAVYQAGTSRHCIVLAVLWARLFFYRVHFRSQLQLSS